MAIRVPSEPVLQVVVAVVVMEQAVLQVAPVVALPRLQQLAVLELRDRVTLEVTVQEQTTTVVVAVVVLVVLAETVALAPVVLEVSV